MGDPRTKAEIENKAYLRASRYAPPAEWHPLLAGLGGMAAFALPYVFFNGFNGAPLALNAVVGFLLGFIWLKLRQRAHERALDQERIALSATDDGASGKTPAELGPPPDWMARGDTGDHAPQKVRND